MKIGLVGSVSVGKTTLVNELAKLPQFLNYKIATERSKYLRDLGIPLNTDSTLKGQTIFLAERLSELMSGDILTDRTVLDVMAFTQSAKSISQSDKDLFEHYAKTFINEYDYVFYIPTVGVDIEENGVRETNSEYRDLIDFTIRNFIERYKHNIKNFHEISGTTPERISQVLNIINK